MLIFVIDHFSDDRVAAPRPVHRATQRGDRPIPRQRRPRRVLRTLVSPLQAPGAGVRRVGGQDGGAGEARDRRHGRRGKRD